MTPTTPRIHPEAVGHSTAEDGISSWLLPVPGPYGTPVLAAQAVAPVPAEDGGQAFLSHGVRSFEPWAPENSDPALVLICQRLLREACEPVRAAVEYVSEHGLAAYLREVELAEEAAEQALAQNMRKFQVDGGEHE